MTGLAHLNVSRRSRKRRILTFFRKMTHNLVRSIPREITRLRLLTDLYVSGQPFLLRPSLTGCRWAGTSSARCRARSAC